MPSSSAELGIAGFEQLGSKNPEPLPVYLKYLEKI